MCCLMHVVNQVEGFEWAQSCTVVPNAAVVLPGNQRHELN